MAAKLAMQHHGKSKVRLGRVWREGNTHHMVEWSVFSMLDSDMEHAYVQGTNTGMTATDTQKNTVGHFVLPPHATGRLHRMLGVGWGASYRARRPATVEGAQQQHTRCWHCTARLSPPLLRLTAELLIPVCNHVRSPS